MSDKKTVYRHKTVRHRGVSLSSDLDGTVTVSIADSERYDAKQVTLTEQEYLALFDNSGAMVCWPGDDNN